MRRTMVALFLVLLGAAPLFAQAPALRPALRDSFVAVSAPVVALNHVRVVDGTGAGPVDDQTIVIANGKIQAVGKFGSTPVPAGAQAMDLKGHTVIPGIVGMHDHAFYGSGVGPGSTRYAFSPTASPRLYLGSGVTTTRTTGGYSPYEDIDLAKRIERGEAIGTRMYLTGPYLSSGTGNLGAMVIVDTPEAARRVVDYWVEEGVTWFKAYTNITRAALGAAIDEAHKHGVKVTAHLCSVGYREAVAMGIDGLEHGLPGDMEFHPNKKPDECPREPMDWSTVDVNGPAVQATIHDMVAKNVELTSTLAVFESSVPNRPPLEPRVLDAMAPDARTNYQTFRYRALERPNPAALVRLKKEMEFEVAFVKAGGLMVAGVDPTGNGGALAGFGDQRNFELLIEAGFTPLQAVQIMTSNGAKVLGAYDRFGSVTAGKVADLVVIKGDPIARPAEIRNVTIVFKDGVGYDSAKLLESVKGLAGLR